MDTGQLTAFSTVAECLSFSKASEQLFLTQSAVSKRVATLESELDVTLFERFGQRIQLTDAGRILLHDAREILDKVQQMHHRSDVSKQRIAGKLRVATSHHIGLHRLPTILQKFVKEYPEVQLDMHFLDSEIAYEEISHGTYDIAVATLPNTAKKMHGSTEIIPLWDDELAIMFSTSHPMSKKETINAATLAEYPAILPDESTFTRRIINGVFNESDITCNVAFTTNYLETIKVMVETGMGWSVLPKIMHSELLCMKEIPGLDAHPETPTRQLGIMLHKNKIMTPALQELVAALKAHIKE